LCACSGFFDKDNTPTPTKLTAFSPTTNAQLLWYTSVNSGMGNDYLKLVPAVTNKSIVTVGENGLVTATDKLTGRINWRSSTNTSITSGPAANDGLVVVGGRDGEVVALDEQTGGIRWKTSVNNELLSPPALAKGIVIVKAIDGHLSALSEQDGHKIWSYDQAEPALILRGGSTPQMTSRSVIVGFANGTLAKLSIHSGSLLWQQVIATPQGGFAIERMVDIDADPLVFNDEIYAATYQGKIASLDISSGKSLWNRDISSFTGMTADSSNLYISDATSNLWAFQTKSGNITWKQDQLIARNITAPESMGRYLVVGDSEGYLHWIDKANGQFAARTRVNRSGILAKPVVDNNIIYALTKDGHLAAYKLP
jgi:outer membrane protein assembly factor BamB